MRESRSLHAVLKVIGRGKELLDEKWGSILGLREVGTSIKDIARRHKRSRTFVRAALQL